MNIIHKLSETGIHLKVDKAVKCHKKGVMGRKAGNASKTPVRVLHTECSVRVVTNTDHSFEHSKCRNFGTGKKGCYCIHLMHGSNFFNFEMWSYRRTSFWPRTLNNIARVIDLFYHLGQRMSGIGSFGLDSTFCVISCMGQSFFHRVLLSSSNYISCPVLHQEATLQKICPLEKNPSSQQAHHLSLYPNYERTTAVPLLLHGLHVLPAIILR